MYLTYNIWVEWNTNPVIMKKGKFDDSMFKQIPYPTITICPDTKTSKSKFEISATLKNKHNLSEIE